MGLIIICGGTGYYGANKLIESLNYITGPAWDTADGAMEGAIGIEAQMIAVNKVVAGRPEANTRLKTGIAMADEALQRMEDAQLISLESIELLHQSKPKFVAARNQILIDYGAFAKADSTLSKGFVDFQVCMVQAEEFGDSAVEALEGTPNQMISWNSGLGELWSAADGAMEATIFMLERIYFYRRLISAEDEKDMTRLL